MFKTVFVKKSPKSDYFWNHYSKRKVDQLLTVEDFLRKYKGFEGDLIRICFNEQEVREVQDMLNSDFTSIRLDLYSGKDIMDENQRENFSFFGYEYGMCEEDGALYSSIFNEVLFGGVEELRKFYESLNENFLFPNIKIAEKYVEIHQKLFDEGKDVEWPISMQIYEVGEVR